MSINMPCVLRLLENSEEQVVDSEYYKHKFEKVTHELQKLKKKFNVGDERGETAREKEN